MKHSYSILVVAALPAEMRVLKRLFAERKHERIHVSFLTTGMGNFAMTHALTKELEKNQYDFILNLGICGYGSKKLDMVQIVRSVYAPTQKELLVPVFTTFASLGSIMCDEKPVKEISDDSIQYADMESYGFEWVASKYLTPRVVLKIPIDQIGESLDLFHRDEALGLFEKHIDAPHIFETIIAYLDWQKEEKTFAFLDSLGHLTFSERKILTRLARRYEALSGEKVECFFSDLWEAAHNKKEVTKRLKEYPE